MKNIFVPMLLAFALLFSACNNEQNKESQTGSGDMPAMNAQETNTPAGIVISGAWLRPAGKNTNAGMFLNILNNSDMPDTLTGAKSNAAEKTEIHETFKKGNDMMGMREVKNIVIEPRETFVLKPMDHHIMLIKTNKDLKIGDSVNVTLTFSRAGEIPVNAVVKEQMPAMKK